MSASNIQQFHVLQAPDEMGDSKYILIKSVLRLNLTMNFLEPQKAQLSWIWLACVIIFALDIFFIISILFMRKKSPFYSMYKFYKIFYIPT